MADNETKIRTKTQDGVTDIMVRVSHPMETGLRPDPKDKTKKIPAHFIQKLNISVNGKDIASTDLGTAISKDPLVAIKVKALKPGDKVKVTWSDNLGQSGSGESTVS